MKRKVLWFVMSGLVLILCAVALVVKLGLVPVNADARPSSLETRILPMALHASVVRGARSIRRSRPLSDEDVGTGKEIYSAMCAECHGRPDGRASIMGMSFYPPAPQFHGRPTSYTDPELFWVVKHGIRDTGMPSWGNRLSDQDIWNLVAFLKTLS